MSQSVNFVRTNTPLNLHILCLGRCVKFNAATKNYSNTMALLWKFLQSAALTILLAGNFASLSMSTPAPPSATKGSLFNGLETSPLFQASTGSPVALPLLWRSGTPFGLGDKVAVVTFHF